MNRRVTLGRDLPSWFDSNRSQLPGSCEWNLLLGISLRWVPVVEINLEHRPVLGTQCPQYPEPLREVPILDPDLLESIEPPRAVPAGQTSETRSECGNLRDPSAAVDIR